MTGIIGYVEDERSARPEPGDGPSNGAVSAGRARPVGDSHAKANRRTVNAPGSPTDDVAHVSGVAPFEPADQLQLDVPAFALVEQAAARSE